MSICSYVDENTRWDFSDSLRYLGIALISIARPEPSLVVEDEWCCWDLHPIHFPEDKPLASM